MSASSSVERDMDRHEFALDVRQVSKRFGPTLALDDVTFGVERGTVHGLVGGNGSGKSTLIKALAGVQRADSGTFGLLGREIIARDSTPAAARQASLRFVHQQNSVFADLTVAENLSVGTGFALGVGGRIRWREQRRRAQAVLDRFEISADPGQLLTSLRPAVQSMITIARALQDQESRHGGVLVLDEPTASLPSAEVDVLLGALRRYASAGQTIVFVSHRLEEILSVTDSLTVLRDGRVVAHRATAGLTPEDLAEHIAGRRLAATAKNVTSAALGSKPVLEVENLSGGAVRGATFQVRPGEVIGIAGLLGSGRSSLLRLLFGAVARESGSVAVQGSQVDLSTPAEAMRAGIAYVPEDRVTESTFAGLNVRENLSLGSLDRYWRRGVLASRRESKDARALVSEYAIKCAGTLAPIGSLSGGNQQKVVLARWIRREPRVLLLDEPTHGVDVGARAEIYQSIRNVVATGACVLLVSSDAEELDLMSDRILVIREGRVVDEVASGAADEGAIESLIRESV